MSFTNIEEVIDAMVSHALSLGYFDAVNGFEPTADPTPGNGLTAAVWVQEVAPAPKVSGLASTSMVFTLNIRLYLSLLIEPKDYIDPEMVRAVDALFTAYIGDFQLGGQVMQVDVLGAHSNGLVAEAGYLEQASGNYRVYDLSVPLVLVDVWPQAA